MAIPSDSDSREPRIWNRLSSYGAQFQGAKPTIVQALRRRMLRRDALRRGDVLRRVDVEERIDRLGRPVGDGDAVPRGPDLDLVQAFDRSAPGAGRRAAPPATAPTTGCRHSPERAQASGSPAAARACMQPRHEIARQERAVARHARDTRRCPARAPPPSRARRGCRRAGRRSPARSSAHHRQAGVGEARRIAIGVEDERARIAA